MPADFPAGLRTRFDERGGESFTVGLLESTPVRFQTQNARGLWGVSLQSRRLRHGCGAIPALLDKSYRHGIAHNQAPLVWAAPARNGPVLALPIAVGDNSMRPFDRRNTGSDHLLQLVYRSPLSRRRTIMHERSAVAGLREPVASLARMTRHKSLRHMAGEERVIRDDSNRGVGTTSQQHRVASFQCWSPGGGAS